MSAKQLGACLLLRNQAGQILLVKDVKKAYWMLPGGIIDPNESPRQAALRETKEEVGINAEKANFVVVDYRSDRDSLEFLFDGGTLTSLQIKQIVLQESELSQYRFASIEAAFRLVSPQQARRLASANQSYLEDQV